MPTVVVPSTSTGAMARQLASSQRAMRRGRAEHVDRPGPQGPCRVGVADDHLRLAP